MPHSICTSAGAMLFTPQALDLRRKNLESLTKGLGSYMEHVPMVARSREAVVLAKRRRDELAENKKKILTHPLRESRDLQVREEEEARHRWSS